MFYIVIVKLCSENVIVCFEAILHVTSVTVPLPVVHQQVKLLRHRGTVT